METVTLAIERSDIDIIVGNLSVKNPAKNYCRTCLVAHMANKAFPDFSGKISVGMSDIFYFYFNLPDTNEINVSESNAIKLALPEKTRTFRTQNDIVFTNKKFDDLYKLVGELIEIPSPYSKG